MNSIVRTLIVLAACGLYAGCEQFNDPNHSPAPIMPQVGTAGAPTAAANQPSTAPARTGPVAVLVNGQPIYLADIDDLLIREAGMPVAQQLIASELVRQYAAKENVTVDDKDVREENERAVTDMFPTVDSAADRDKLLNQTLAKKSFSRQQWDLVVRRNALLVKIAARRVQVSQDDIHDAFELEYGKKVIVRHIQCASVADAQKVLALATKNPTDFPALAQKYSTNATAQSGGLVQEPIGPKSALFPPAFQQAALSLKKVGEISDIVAAGTAFHILRLEQVIDPQDVKFDDVKDKVAKAVRSRKLRVEQTRILTDMVKAAKIEYVNPILKDQSHGQGGQASE